jgi:hypothetical protein
MKRLATAVAFSLAFTSLAPMAAAQETSQFRSVEAQAFTTEELQQYGLSAEEAAQVAAYQDQGYSVVVMTPEEAAQYQAGVSSSTILIIGIVAVVILAIGITGQN